MELSEKINLEFTNALREKDMKKRNLLGVIKGEIENEKGRGVSINNSVVLTILSKMEKSLKQTNTTESLSELEIIKPYIPSKMSDKEIREIITSYKVNGICTIGNMMAEFNKTYKGKADNKLVSDIIKEILNES